MFGLKLMLFSPVTYLMPMLIISSQAHRFTAETIMQKEMEWAKRSMEKHHKSRGYLPLRIKESITELFPLPDIDYDKDEVIDKDSSPAEDVDLNSVPLLLEPDKASNKLRRRNIPDEIQHQQNETEQVPSSPRAL